jgi:transcriptional regulator with XRE-family HTH domain
MTYIKQIRKEKGLSRREMAENLNMNLDAYRGVERGDRATSTKTIKKLMKLYPEIDINKFFK